MSATISSHVLDTSRGKPAAGVHVTLEHKDARGHWVKVGEADTDHDGRVRSAVPAHHRVELGVYRLTFDTGAYAREQLAETFFPEVSIVFEIKEATHHHVPLLLSHYGYSTYRGS